MNKNLKYVFWLSAITYFTQGLESIVGQPMFVYFKKVLHLSPSIIMYIGSITGIAWLLKIVWGYLVDNYLTKRTWYFIALGISSALALTLGIYGFMLSVLIAIITLTSTATAIRDVTVDGIMCVEGKKNNICGNIQAVQWISITIASIIVGLVGGWLATTANYKLGFLILVPIYLVSGIITYKYKEPVKEIQPISCIETFKKYKILWKNKSFLIGCAFMFLYCFAPSFGTPLSFIQRDSFHWSEKWIGILGAIISICEIAGAILYFKFSKRINVRKWLLFSVFFGALTTMCYLYYTNVSAIVYGIAFAIIGMVIHLILMDFTARTSINGLEASSFAILCGIHNLAGTASALTGAWLFPLIGLKPLIIIASLTSFACLPLIKHLRLENDKTDRKELCKCH